MANTLVVASVAGPYPRNSVLRAICLRMLLISPSALCSSFIALSLCIAKLTHRMSLVKQRRELAHPKKRGLIVADPPYCLLRDSKELDE